MSDPSTDYRSLSPVEYFTRAQASPGWARVLDSFARFAAPRPGQRALDVGCGPGALVRRLAALGCSAVGADADPAMLARAHELAPALPFTVGNALALPFADESFDHVTATNLLFLLPNPQAGLSEMARVCKPGGSVAVLNPSPALSQSSAQAHATAVGLTGFDEYSFVNWGRLAEAYHRLSAEALPALFNAARLRFPEIAERIGDGFALLAKGEKRGAKGDERTAKE